MIKKIMAWNKINSSEREKLLKIVLPPIILIFVICFECLFYFIEHNTFKFVSHLLIYGLTGSLVTYVLLEWISEGNKIRLKTEKDLRALYDELRYSHEQLKHMQNLMHDLTKANDLISLIEISAIGVKKVSAAKYVEIILDSGLNFKIGEETKYKYEEEILQYGKLKLAFENRVTIQDKNLVKSLAGEIGIAIRLVQQRMQDLLSLGQVDESIRAERNMHILLTKVTDLMSKTAKASIKAVYLVDQDGVLRSEIFSIPSLKNTPKFACRVAKKESPVFASESELQEFLDAKMVIGFPLRDKNGLVGVLILGDKENHPTEADIALLSIMASQATFGIRNARAYYYSEEIAISNERARIAREIHDGIAQSLAFCAIRLDIVKKNIVNDPEKAILEIEEAGSILREQIQEIRRSIFALRPINLEKYGLLKTLDMYVNDFGQQNKIKANFSYEGELKLTKGDEAVLFRTVQESLNNVAKHAQATSVNVYLESEDNFVSLLIRDNGKGFNIENTENKISSASGLGLCQMRERIDACSGIFDIKSSPNKGTLIRVKIPIVATTFD